MPCAVFYLVPMLIGCLSDADWCVQSDGIPASLGLYFSCFVQAGTLRIYANHTEVGVTQVVGSNGGTSMTYAAPGMVTKDALFDTVSPHVRPILVSPLSCGLLTVTVESKCHKFVTFIFPVQGARRRRNFGEEPCLFPPLFLFLFPRVRRWQSYAPTPSFSFSVPAPVLSGAAVL